MALSAHSGPRLKRMHVRDMEQDVIALETTGTWFTHTLEHIKNAPLMILGLVLHDSGPGLSSG